MIEGKTKVPNPVRFRLLGPDGTPVGWTFETAREAGEYAALRWPHLKQDEDRMGKGWDVEVARGPVQVVGEK